MRTLVVMDWKVDPGAVAEFWAGAGQDDYSARDLLVPARLHGLDWAGDPYVSLPCARKAAEEVFQLLQAAGLQVDSVRVGDPDPVAAIIDALSDQPADRLILLERPRRLGTHPLDLAHRARRATALPVARLTVEEGARDRRPRPLAGLLNGQCSLAAVTRTAVHPAH
jgi:hypothetical protein